MRKQILLLSLFTLLAACGQKSIIKNAVQPQTTAEAYGDGEYVIRPIVMPLSDQAIAAFDSPVEKVDFVAGGFARMFMNLGTSMGMGRVQLSLTQPIPEIPTEIIQGAKIKRLFFYLEPKQGSSRWKTWLKKIIRGQGDVTFGFLEKLALKISSTSQKDFVSWYPEFETKSLKKKEFSPLQGLFEGDVNESAESFLEDSSSLVVLKYARDNREKYLRNNKYGLMYIIRTRQPAKTKKYLSKHPQFRGYFKQIQMLNETLLVELKKDPVVEEGFRYILSENADLVEKFKIDLIEECTQDTCLDLKVPDVDLLPLMVQGNALKMDAYMNADKAPESFQLKGFVEFEVKLKLTF